MKFMVRLCIATLFALNASTAFAAFHLFTIEQIYSNASGTVQFVVLTSFSDGEDKWSGRALTSSSAAGTKRFVFPSDLPGAHTAGKRVLVGTEGFAALGIVTPDFVMPNNFIATGTGMIDYADVYTVAYNAGELPTDGVNALYSSDPMVKRNVATNFAGQTGSVSTGSPAATNYQGLWYAAPAESEAGWGINFAHQGDIIFATWFTYDATGKAWWLTMTAPKSAEGVYSGTLYKTTGAPFSAFVPPAVATQVGTGTLTFTSASTGTFAYVVNGIAQTKAIVPQVFGPVPACVFGAQPDLTRATNFQDLWYAAPAESEAGWGINLTQQGTKIFATWFTYDANRNPLWLSATAPQTGTNTYAGTLNLTTGPAFSAVPFAPSQVTVRSVGNVSFSFTNGNSGTFGYNVDLGDGVNKATQSKAITRQVFRAPGTVCQ
jgi:hypothetical protein